MSERYWITGVQIGMLKAFAQMNDPDKDQDIDNILDKVIEEQFIGNLDVCSTKNEINSPQQSNPSGNQEPTSNGVRKASGSTTNTLDSEDIHSQIKKEIDKDYDREICGYCGKDYDDDYWIQTEKCKHCGEFLDNPPYIKYAKDKKEVMEK